MLGSGSGGALNIDRVQHLRGTHQGLQWPMDKNSDFTFYHHVVQRKE